MKVPIAVFDDLNHIDACDLTTLLTDQSQIKDYTEAVTVKLVVAFLI